jgi:hypothetical protein
MTEIIDEKKTTLPAWKCILDADKRSQENLHLFTSEHQAVTEELAARAENIYPCKGVYVNFRKGMSAVKLHCVRGEYNTEAAIALGDWAIVHGFEKFYIRGSGSIKFTKKRKKN